MIFELSFIPTHPLPLGQLPKMVFAPQFVCKLSPGQARAACRDKSNIAEKPKLGISITKIFM